MSLDVILDDFNRAPAGMDRADYGKGQLAVCVNSEGLVCEVIGQRGDYQGNLIPGAKNVLLG